MLALTQHSTKCLWILRRVHCTLLYAASDYTLQLIYLTTAARYFCEILNSAYDSPIHKYPYIVANEWMYIFFVESDPPKAQGHEWFILLRVPSVSSSGVFNEIPSAPCGGQDEHFTEVGRKKTFADTGGGYMKISLPMWFLLLWKVIRMVTWHKQFRTNCSVYNFMLSVVFGIFKRRGIHTKQKGW